MNPIEMAGQMFNSLKQNVGNAFSRLGSGVQNVANTVGQDFSNVANTVGGDINQVSKSLPDISGLFNSPSIGYQDIKPVVDTFSNAVSQVPSLVQQAYKNIAPNVSSTINNTPFLPNYVGMGWNQPLPQVVKNFAQGLTTNMQDVPSNIENGSPYSLGNFLGNDLVGGAVQGAQQAGKLGFNVTKGLINAGMTAGLVAGANQAAGKPNTLQGIGVPALIGGVVGTISPQEARYAVKNFDPQSVNLLKDFVSHVQTNGAQATYENSATVHSIATDVFGDKAANWGNQKMAGMFASLLKLVGTRQNNAGLGLSTQNISEGKGGLLPFGETSGIQPEAAKNLEAIKPTIFANRANYDNPEYFAKTFLDDKSFDDFLKSDTDLNNHQGGPQALQDVRGTFGYIATDQLTVPPDKNVPSLVIDNHVSQQFTVNNGDRVLSIVQENQNKPGMYTIVDGHHTFPTARAIGLDKVPVIILDDKQPLLKDSFEAIKNGQPPVDIKSGMSVPKQSMGGEAALTPDKIKELVPELSTDAGKAKVQSILDKTKAAQPSLDERFQQIAKDAGLDPTKDFESRIKQPDTFVQKVAQHRLEGTEEYDARGVNDPYGGRFIANTPQQKGQIISAINAMDREGELRIMKQQQVTKDTYSAYHIDFIKNGVRGEIQIHDPNSLLESVVNHEIRSQAGENPPPVLDAEKKANAQAAAQMPPEAAQTLAQAGEEAKRKGEPLPWETSNKEGVGDYNIDLGGQFTNTPPKTYGSIPPGEGQGATGIAAINPKDVAKQARLARSGSVGAINFRAQTLAQQMNQVLKTPEDNLNIRLAMESPAKLNEYAAQSSNPQAFKDIAQKYSAFTDHIANQLKQTGGTMNFVNDYFTHIWDLSTPEAQQTYNDLIASNAKNFQSGFTKQRLVNTIQEGLDKGLQLKNVNASQDVIRYANSMGIQIGASVFNQRLNELRPGGAVEGSVGAGTYNYQGRQFLQSNVPGNQGTFIDPEVQKHLNYYNPSAIADNPVVQTADKANRALKTWDLSFGGFHALKTTARALVTDPTIIPTAIRNSVDEGARTAFNQKAINDGVIDYGSKIGVTFSGPGDINPQGMIANIASKNPIEKMNQSLFGGLINTYKVDTVRNIMNKFDLSNPSEFQKAQAYGAQINDLFGGLNYETLGRNKTVQQLLRFGVLASDFNEGKIRQIATAFNPRDWSPAAMYSRQSLLGEAAVFAILAETGRKLVTGQFDSNIKDFVNHAILNPSIPLPNNQLFNNNNKQQTAGLPSSDIGDIYRAATNPQQFLQARGAVLPRTIGQLKSGLDYYGRPLVAGNQPDTLVNRAKALIPANLPIAGVQILKTTQGKETPVDAVLNVLGMRVTNNPDDPTVKAQQQYFTGLKSAHDGITGADAVNQQKVFDTLHPLTKDSQGNPIIDKTIYQKPWYYDTLLHHPQVMAAEAAFQKSQPNHSPLWDLPDNQRNIVMAAADKLPGQKSTYTTMLQTQPWYQSYLAAQSQWYQSLPQQTQPVATSIPYPQPTAQAQTAMNAKQWSNPEVQSYFQALDAYNNQQLQAMGLPPTAGQTTGGLTSRTASMIRSRLPIRTSTTSAKLKAVASTAGGKGISLIGLKGTGGMLATKGLKNVVPPKLAKVPKVSFRGGTGGKIKGLSAKVATPKQPKVQSFKMPALQKINMKKLGSGFHSKTYGKYSYQ